MMQTARREEPLNYDGHDLNTMQTAHGEPSAGDRVESVPIIRPA